MNKRIGILFIFLMGLVSLVWGQQAPKDSLNDPENNSANVSSEEPPAQDKVTGAYQFEHNYFPASPNAASLGAYGETPVSYYTGTPNINIPVYEMKGVELSLPISLSYNASGIRVDDNASWVGLGWSLNAGGAITRNIRGLDDLSPGPFIELPLTEVEDGINTDYEHTFDQLVNYATAFHDSEPDIFFFNFMGYTGSFVFDSNNEPVFSEYVNFDVQLTSFGITIISDDGTVYDFNENEVTDGKTVAWNLTKITSSSGRCTSGNCDHYIEFMIDDHFNII